MNTTTDLTRAVDAVRHFETLLRDRYRARGSGLTQKTKSVARNLHKDTVDRLIYIASVRNKMVHEKVDSIPDKNRFEKACADLEEFFKEAITSEPIVQPEWTSPINVGVWPKPLECTRQQHLYTIINGRVNVYEEGLHKIRRSRGMTECGFICMMPQALARIEIAPLLSKDSLALTMSIEASVSVAETKRAISEVILAADQQIETLKSRILVALQEICSKIDYDNIFGNLHEVASKVKSNTNANPFVIVDCAIVECELEDSEIEEMRRHQQRSVEKTKKEMEEKEHLSNLERIEQQLQKEKNEMERKLALANEEHFIQMQKIKGVADKQRHDLEVALQKEKEKNKHELAILASEKNVEVEKYKAEASQHELGVMGAKADIANHPSGKYVLFPDKSHDIERSRLIQNAELLRATLSEKKVLQLLHLAASSGFTQAETEVLKTNFQHIFAETRQLTEGAEAGESAKETPQELINDTTNSIESEGPTKGST